MSNQYAGGFISKTPPTVTTSSAQGMWTLSQQAQYQKAGVWPTPFPNGWPANIGDAYGGGFFAGQINVSGTKYNLVVAPKSTGDTSGLTYGPRGTSTGATSTTNGGTNTTTLVSLGSAYQAAIFCNNLNAGAGLNGYKDWYLPAIYELEPLYYYLKQGSSLNDSGSGANPNAVSPEPVNTNYTSGSPAQTSVAIFKNGGSECFNLDLYVSSTEYDANFSWRQNTNVGTLGVNYKNDGFSVRAIRRVPV